MQTNLYKSVLIIACFFYFSCSVFGQQEAMNTQYMFNTLVYNPSYAGTKDAISTAAIYRQQWVSSNFEGAPRTISAYVHGPVREKIGLGLSVQSDQLGVHDWLNIRGNYSYKFYVSPRSKVSLGLSTSFSIQQSDYNSVMGANGDVTTDITFSENRNKVLPNFGFGAFYYSNWYYVGFSIPNILNNKLSAFSAQQYRHYYGSAGMVLPVTKSIKVKPAVLLKSVGGNAPTELDLSVNVYFFNTIWTGLAFRTRDSFDMLLGIQVNRSLKIGYAFDLITTELNNHTDLHTHEIMIGYDFNFGPSRIITPRYF